MRHTATSSHSVNNLTLDYYAASSARTYFRKVRYLTRCTLCLISRFRREVEKNCSIQPF
jgi:hypothetical protein